MGNLRGPVAVRTAEAMDEHGRRAASACDDVVDEWHFLLAVNCPPRVVVMERRWNADDAEMCLCNYAILRTRPSAAGPRLRVERGVFDVTA